MVLMCGRTDIENLVTTCSGLKALRKLHDENPALDVKSKILQRVNSGNSGPLLLGPNGSARSTLIECIFSTAAMQSCSAGGSGRLSPISMRNVQS